MIKYLEDTMRQFQSSELKKLYIPPADSHKGQNGKLLIVAGSQLFHAPAIWPAEIASRIVDMVYVASTPENNEILQKLKGKFWDGIVVKRQDLDSYAQEADCILIGPGLPRPEGQQEGDDDTNKLTRYVLAKFIKQQFVIDGGALQTMEVSWIPRNSILTPHHVEFMKLFKVGNDETGNLKLETGKVVHKMAREHHCIILLKGKEDIVCSPEECRVVKGGNAGMTKGGTGDVLAGLVAALVCKNDPFLAACAGSYINKAAGDSLLQKVGYYYNASDLLGEIPQVMKREVNKI